MAVLVCVSAIVCLLVYNSLKAAEEVSVADMADGNAAVEYNIEHCGDDIFEATMSTVENGNQKIISYKGNGSQYLRIKGWAYRPGEDIKTADSAFMLREPGTDKYIKLKTVMEKRQDVTDKFGENQYSYNLSGLVSIVKKSDLKPGVTYDVYIAYGNDGSNLLVNTFTKLQA